MPTKSSDIGTEQDSGNREVTMSSKKSTVPTKAEAAAKELVDERLPDEQKPLLEVNRDAVAEAAAQVLNTDAVEEAAVQAEASAAQRTAAFLELMESGRERIDAIDDQILELVERRMAMAGELLTAKDKRGINLRDKLRQGEMIDRLSAAAETLNRYQVREMFELFIRLGVDRFRQNIIDGRRGR